MTTVTAMTETAETPRTPLAQQPVDGFYFRKMIELEEKRKSSLSGSSLSNKLSIGFNLLAGVLAAGALAMGADAGPTLVSGALISQVGVFMSNFLTATHRGWDISPDGLNEKSTAMMETGREIKSDISSIAERIGTPAAEVEKLRARVDAYGENFRAMDNANKINDKISMREFIGATSAFVVGALGAVALGDGGTVAPAVITGAACLGSAFALASNARNIGFRVWDIIRGNQAEELARPFTGNPAPKI